MKPSKPALDMYFVSIFWKFLRMTIERTEMVAILITVLASVVFLNWVEGWHSEIWISVAGGVVASAIFLLVQWIASIALKTERRIYEQKYREYVDELGIKNIFPSRGGDEIKILYRGIIANAKTRIWAVGMTNTNFINQHGESLASAIKEHKGIDVVIAFWNPKSQLEIHNKTTSKLSIIDVQNMIEGRGHGKKWGETISKRYHDILEDLDDPSFLLGRIRIIYFSLVTNISCLVVDNDVLFFPFLSGHDSNNDPMIHCSAQHGVGKSICDHVRHMINHDTFAHVVEERGV